ncbi:MAG: nicotinate-nucleotide diphosphorylase (carboxylating), partial [Candidatus Omnitrophica bacterium]|nr:nicotinate-nucleotide diphosphorylase (carboxylating) [Candidatus Omnitrophota bacterium]
MKEIDLKRIDTIIRFALKEDIGSGDITSNAVIPEGTSIDAVILARQDGVVCGAGIAERVFAAVDPQVRYRPMVTDGEFMSPGKEIAFVEGNARSILKAERTAINFLGLLSGVATRTREMVEAVKG